MGLPPLCFQDHIKMENHTMAFLNKSAKFEIASGQFITLDSEDFDRVSSRTWTPFPAQVVTYITNVGTPARPAYQLLGGFILGVKPHVFVEQIDKRKPNDYRRSNLRIR